MNAESDLLRAVLENPFDDGPRLVYADWLDEHGEPQKARFIRRQINEGHVPMIFPPGDRIVIHDFGPTANGMGTIFVFLLADGIPVVTVAVQRGFPSEVRLTLAKFMGIECRTCVGTGIGASAEVAQYIEIAGGCPRCDGTGRTPGLAKEIFSRWPVTRVVLSDTVIHDSGGNDTCYIGGLGSFPQEYWRRLDNHKNHPAARRALSEVCVDYGRSLAGLPPIQWPEKRPTADEVFRVARDQAIATPLAWRSL